jgi:hypothetical protein
MQRHVAILMTNNSLITKLQINAAAVAVLLIAAYRLNVNMTLAQTI